MLSPYYAVEALKELRLSVAVHQSTYSFTYNFSPRCQREIHLSFLKGGRLAQPKECSEEVLIATELFRIPSHEYKGWLKAAHEYNLSSKFSKLYVQLGSNGSGSLCLQYDLLATPNCGVSYFKQVVKTYLHTLEALLRDKGAI